MKSVGTATLETDRLILRQFRNEDAEMMFNNWASDEEVTKYLTWPAHKSVETTKALLKEWTEKYSDPDYYNWVIELKESGEVIGNISVVDLEKEIESATIGYCLGRESWGKGIAPEALGEIIAFLIDEVELNRVAAYHDALNPRSGRVMQKTGMKFDGILRSAARDNQGICDAVWYSVLKDEV